MSPLPVYMNYSMSVFTSLCPVTVQHVAFSSHILLIFQRILPFVDIQDV